MTTIFSDTFESGNLSNWTGQYYSNGSSTVATDQKYYGTYAGKFAVTSNDGYADTYKTLGSTYSTLYYRCFLRFSALPTTGKAFILMNLANTSNNNAIGGFGLGYDGGAAKFKVSYLKTGSYVTVYSSTNTPQVDTWYEVKIKLVVSSTSGTVECWVNKTKDNDLSDTSGFDNNDYGDLNIAFCGVDTVTESSYPVTVWVDYPVVSDSPILYPYVEQVSNVDGTADVGTHSGFANQQAAADSTYDTLTEADTDTGTSQLGDTSGSGTSYRTTAANEMRLFSIQAANTGQVDSIVFYGRGNAASVNCKGIVTDSSGNLLTNGVGDAVSVSTTAGNKTLTFTNKPKIVAGTTYWFGVITAGAVRIYYDSTTGGSMKRDTSNSYTTPTSPTDAGSTTETWRVFYANITELNYELQLEQQFTAIPYASLTTPQLHVTTGTFSADAETLNVEVWDGANWDSLGALTASTDNVFSLAGYVTSADLYIRFHDGTTSNDPTASTWQIDAVYISDSYTKTFTVNAELIAVTTYTKTFTVNANLTGTLNKSLTVNGNLLKNFTKTFTTNGNLLKNYTKTFTANSNLLAQYSKTFTVNGNLLANLTKTFTVNGGLLQNFTKTFTINSNLLASYTKTFTVNANLLGVYAVPFTANANLTANLTKTFTVNGNLLAEYLKTFSVGANLQGNYTVPFTANAALLGNLTKTFTVNGNLLKEQNKTFTLNAEIASIATGSTEFNYNANLTQNLTQDFTYNAELIALLTSAPTTENTGIGFLKRHPKLRGLDAELLQLILEYLELKQKT